MKVLKFGGTSVGSPENIRKVGDILLKQSGDQACIVVVSAMGGVTDLLIRCSNLAALGMDNPSAGAYQQILKEIEDRHLTTIRELLPIKSQSNVLSQTKMLLNNLEDILKGVFLVNSTISRVSEKGYQRL